MFNAGDGLTAVVDDVRAVLAGLGSTEARLAATGVVIALTIAAAVVLAPRLVRGSHRLVRDRVLGDDRVPVDVSEFDWRVPVTAISRVLQVSILVTSVLAVLVVWGLTGLALTATELLLTAVPRVVQLLTTGVILVGALIGIDVLESWLDSYAEQSDALDQHQQGIVFRVLQLSVLAAAAIAGLGVWGVPLDGLLVGAGFLGIVIGTAARTTIGSLIAGFVLMFSRPFELGDWVEIDGDEGIVSDITVINTRIRNQHGEVIVIPNERVANATITNRTRLGRLRLSVDVGVDYEADVSQSEAIALEALEDVNEILDTPRPQVVPKSLGDSAVVLECRFWIDHPSAAKRTMAKAAVVREVKGALDEAGVKIPYPQRELTGREEAGGFTVRRPRAPTGESRSAEEPHGREASTSESRPGEEPSASESRPAEED